MASSSGGERVVVEEERPRRHRVARLLGALLFLVVLAAIALVIVVSTTSSDDAKDDVTVSRCEAQGDGQPTASGRIQNDSSKTSNYAIRIDFTDPDGNTVSEGAATVKSVEANGTAQWQLTGARDVSGPVRCEINRVSRTHLPGQ